MNNDRKHGIPTKDGIKDPAIVSIAQPLSTVRTNAPSTRRRLSALSWSQPFDETMDKLRKQALQFQSPPLVFLGHPKEWKDPLAPDIAGQGGINHSLPTFGNRKLHRTKLSWSPLSDEEEEASFTAPIPPYRIRSRRVPNNIGPRANVSNNKKTDNHSKVVECESPDTLTQEAVSDAFKQFRSPGSGKMVVRLQPEDPSFKSFLSFVDTCSSIPSSQSPTILILRTIRFVDGTGTLLTPESAYSFVEEILQARISKRRREPVDVSQKVITTLLQRETEHLQTSRDNGTCNAAFRKEVRGSILKYESGEAATKRSIVTSIIDRFHFRSKDDRSVMTDTVVFNLVQKEMEKEVSRSSRELDTTGSYRQALLHNEHEFRCGDEATKHSLVMNILSRFELIKGNVLLTVSEQYHEVENGLLGDMGDRTVPKLRNLPNRQDHWQSTLHEATTDYEASNKDEAVLNLPTEGRNLRKRKLPDLSEES